MNSTVSVITVVLNDRAGYEKTAQSILRQDYPALEWIVIDGGSTDGTAMAINSIGNRISYHVSEPDGGFYEAMNKGLSKATGEWVNFMNAGDIFASDNVISVMMAGDLAGAGVVYGDSLAGYRHGPVLRKATTPEGLDRGMTLCHQSVFVRTDLAKKEAFDLRYRIGADYDQLLKLRAQGCRFRYLPCPVALIDPTGVSNRNMGRSAREHFAIVRKYRKLTLSETMHHVSFIAWVSLVSLGYRLLPQNMIQWIARVK